jgi:hypothetical protein
VINQFFTNFVIKHREMDKILEKLNYKGQKRIALLNADSKFHRALSKKLNSVHIDTEIDQRYPYEFMIIFAKSLSEVESYAPPALHNLLADGILWLCFPKKSSKKFSSDLDRYKIWKAMISFGFSGVRMVTIDDDWSAMRLRNIKFIKPRRDVVEKP